jgi:formylglycine-generating enzyme required for sulfatase activity
MPREVTLAEYQRCVAARRCTPSRGRGRPALPVVGVTLEQAAAYCAFAGTRLPTDREWTAAATADCTRFPAGAGSAAGRSNCISRESGYALRPPGSTPADVVRGVYDLHANAMEWTADGTVRGSRFCSRPLGAREPPPATGHDPYVGFRCMAPVAAGAP